MSTDDTLALLSFDHAPIGLVLTRERVIEACNPAFCETFGHAHEALVGQSLSLLYPSQDEFTRIGVMGEPQMRGSGRYGDERIMRRADGTLFWCRVRGRSFTPDDPFARAVWSMEDISGTRPVVDLTKRERQVAMLWTEGKTSKEIARALGISPRTVEAHRAGIARKLGVRNGAECVARLSGLPG